MSPILKKGLNEKFDNFCNWDITSKLCIHLEGWFYDLYKTRGLNIIIQKKLFDRVLRNAMNIIKSILKNRTKINCHM